jgi:hypothetical protein
LLPGDGSVHLNLDKGDLDLTEETPGSEQVLDSDDSFLGSRTLPVDEQIITDQSNHCEYEIL